jgi:hypothetical protein
VVKEMQFMKTKLTHHLMAALLGVVFTAELHADTLDPLDFASLGTFNVTNGGYIIDTDALTISETNASSTNTLFTGVIDDQDGMADSFGPGGAVTTVGPLGIPHIAVFTFDDLAMDGTATFTVTGHRALALLSQGDALVNAILSLNGEYDSATTNAVPGAGGPGGFDGGAPTLDGEGPGGGGGGDVLKVGAVFGGCGGFGGAGTPGDNSSSFYGDGGLAYGDLRQVLQGGSGGGGVRNTLSPTNEAAGGGGGGALELGATGELTLGGSGLLRANGGFGQSKYAPLLAAGGSGSGGGMRLQASRLFLNGAVQARGTVSGGAPFSGGGRVLRVGDAALPVFTVGSLPAVSSYTNGIDVSGGYRNGWITTVPALTVVPSGTAFELGTITILQTNGYLQTGVELVAGDLIVDGSVTVPAGGITYHHSIELASGNAAVTGSDPLVLGRRGKLSGKGTVQVDVITGAGGNVITINDFLTFTGSISNQLGGEINVVSGTLTVPGDGNGATDDGIVNLGALNLINAVINGDVHSPSNSVVNVAGTATFNGLFKGGASFSGTQNLVTFNGGYEPGDSPAQINFGGAVTFGSGNTLTMELGGTTAGSQYDQLVVGDTATFGGTLNVVLIDSFAPAAGQVFQLFNAATQLGSFTTVNLPTLDAGLAWDNQIAVDGSIAVITMPGGGSQFDSVQLSGTDLIFGGTGGAANGSFVVLSATNVTMPLPNWIPVSTNPFDASGDFLFTNPINPTQPQEFFRLLEQ